MLDEATSQHGQKTVGLDKRKDGVKDLSHENHFSRRLVDRQLEGEGVELSRWDLWLWRVDGFWGEDGEVGRVSGWKIGLVRE